MKRLTLLGRSVVLLTSELLANVVCWVVAGLLFGRREETRDILGLCLLAWTLGLRHALDADHISAIDNATRGLLNLGQLSVLCGLYFSLGHSTIVIVVNVAIAISTDVYDRIGDVGTVGGIVGTAVSASFLFLIGFANSIILYRILKQRRLRHNSSQPSGTIESQLRQTIPQGSIMMRILGRVVRSVDKPWKMYPVGVLFGFGFDTASSIALLAVSAIAKRDSTGKASISSGDVVILPLLFTTGMTLIDSADSVLMLYSYAGFPERGLALYKRMDADTTTSLEDVEATGPLGSTDASGRLPPQASAPAEEPTSNSTGHAKPKSVDQTEVPIAVLTGTPAASVRADDTAEMSANTVLKQNTMSGLSIVLTLISIILAFSISIIEIMGLIGGACTPCENAANDPNGGGLPGRWWRGWANANNQSGLIGAAIVGAFLLIVSGYYGGAYAMKKLTRNRAGAT